MRSPPRAPVDASMTLINEVMHRPLDPGYAEAAERRRAATGGGPEHPVRSLPLLVVAAVLGLVVTAATLALRAPQPDTLQARDILIEQIAEQTTAAEELVVATDDLSGEIAELRTTALAAQDPELLELLARDQIAAGTAAVGGPGVRVTVADAPVAQAEPDAADPDLRVQDVDLQVLVNGLWTAGAEAVAINGQRLTALTAIRTAGSAILVGLAPLSSPYVVEAIGDPETMPTGFARTSAGQHLATLRNTYSIPSEVAVVDDLRLAGSARTRLLAATPLDPGAGAGDSDGGGSGSSPGLGPDADRPPPDDMAWSGSTPRERGDLS